MSLWNGPRDLDQLPIVVEADQPAGRQLRPDEPEVTCDEARLVVAVDVRKASRSHGSSTLAESVAIVTRLVHERVTSLKIERWSSCPSESHHPKDAQASDCWREVA